MARRVKIKKKKPKREPGVTPFRVADFAHPTDLREKATALIVGFGGPAGLIMLMAALPQRGTTVPVALVWSVAAFLAHMWFRPGSELRSLLRNPADSAEDAAFRNVLSMQLERIARVFPPAANVKVAVVPSGIAPLTIGDTILVPASLRTSVGESEMFAILAQQVGYVAAGHTRWLNLVRSVNLLPQYLYWLSLPAIPLAQVLRRWAYYANATADRFAVLVAGDGKLVAQAILRLALNAEPAGTRISAEEMTAHLAKTEALRAEGADIVTHFRLGEYLKDRPELYGRLRQVITYSGSESCKAAAGKLRSTASPQSASG